MRIAIIGPTYPYRSGIAHYATLLYRALRSRHEVNFYSFKKQYPKLLFPGKSDIDKSGIALKEDGVKYVLTPLNPFTWFSAFLKIKKNQPELVIFQWWIIFWAPAFFVLSLLLRFFSKTKILFICHNVKGHERYLLDTLLIKHVLANGDVFIVHSEEDLRKLKKFLPKARALLVPHPIYSVFDFDNLDKSQARQQLAAEGNIVLFFGFVRKYKGLEYLLEAIPLVLKELDILLMVVGEFWRDKSEYEKIIERLGIENNVKIVDQFINNEGVQLYFKAADVVALPYVSGTGSGVLQLAYGFNRPVIATSVGCLRDIVKDGKTGFLVQPKDKNALADAVIRFFRDKKSEEFSRNVEAEKDNYSWEKLVGIIEKI